MKSVVFPHLFALIVLNIFSFSVHAQGEVNNWYFGLNAGITFNTNPPSALTDGQTYGVEGTASISDQDGNLLFYTDGVTVWNKNHQIMPNGTGLLGSVSTVQSAIIVPKPGSSTNYIILTNGPGPSPLYYSEVDMTLNGGLGDVLSDNKNTKLPGQDLPNTNQDNKYVSEACAVTPHADGIRYWIVSHRPEYSRIYYVWLLDCNGITKTSDDGVTYQGNMRGGHWASIKISPNG